MYIKRTFIGIVMIIFLGITGSYPAHAREIVISSCTFDDLQREVMRAEMRNTPSIIIFSCGGSIYFREPLDINVDMTITGWEGVSFHGNQGLFYVLNGASLTLNHISVQSERWVMFIEDGDVTINNSTFSNSGENAGGMIVNSINGKLTIINSLFAGNSANAGGAIKNDGVLSISDSTFSNNSAVFGGGAIFNSNTGFVNSINNTFINNTGGSSGAIYNMVEGIFISQDTDYIHNDCFGEGIIDMGGNTVRDADRCVGVEQPLTEVIVSDCINFEGAGSLSEAITTPNPNGVSISFACEETIIFSDELIITGDVVINGGGVVVLDGNNNTRLFQVRGGAWLTLNDLTVQNATSNNGDGGSSGAILNASGGRLIINNSTFTGNHAPSTGGVLVNAGIATITTSRFSNNSASRGGAINNTGTLRVSNSTFTDNSAPDGGAIYNQNKFFSADSYYANNDCSGATGLGFMIESGENIAENATRCPNHALAPLDVVVSNCNTLSSDGNGTLSEALSTPRVHILRITFTCSGTIAFTRPVQIVGDVIINGGGNVTFDGGGIHRLFEVQGGSSLWLHGVTLQRGYAGNGSAIIVSPGGTLSISNCTFTNNVAQRDGSALNNGRYGTVIIVNSTFTHNSAQAGGAINNSGTMTISDSTFTHNSAQAGGAINNSGTMIITGSHFSDNSATSGGGILNREELHIISSIFLGHEAEIDGGALVNRDGAISTLYSVTFADNIASEGGVVNNDGIMLIEQSNFSMNIARTIGGAIRNGYFGTLNIADSKFTHNSALHGGAMMTINMTTISNSIFWNNTSQVSGDAIDGIFSSRDSSYINNTCVSEHITDNGGNSSYNAIGCP